MELLFFKANELCARSVNISVRRQTAAIQRCVEILQFTSTAIATMVSLRNISAVLVALAALKYWTSSRQPSMLALEAGRQLKNTERFYLKLLIFIEDLHDSAAKDSMCEAGGSLRESLEAMLSNHTVQAALHDDFKSQCSSFLEQTLTVVCAANSSGISNEFDYRELDKNATQLAARAEELLRTLDRGIRSW